MTKQNTHRFNTSKIEKRLNVDLVLNRIFAENVHHHLRKLVKGEIKVYISNDILVIHIYAINGIVFNFTKTDIATAIVHGLDSQTIAQLACKRYDTYIKSLFFQ